MKTSLSSHRMSRRSILKWMGIGSATTVLAACVPVAPPAAPPIAEPVATSAPAASAGEIGTLTFATSSPWGTFSPFRPTYQYGYSSNQIAMLTHSRLFDLDSQGVIHPNLAESWEISEDATQYTFMLRQGVQWHDGEPFTAKDVETTIRFILNKETNINPSNWNGYLKGSQAYYDGETDELAGLRVDDDYTVTLELEAPRAAWHLSSLADLQILPDHIFRDVNSADIVEHHAPAWYTVELNIGTGPFKFVQAERDQFVELARNENYHGGTPKLERILYRNIGTVDTQAIAFERGDLHVWNVPPDYYESAQKLSNTTLHLIDRDYIRVFLMHYESPHLSDKRVRQAIAYGIDREAICETLYSGLCKPYNSFMESKAWLAPGLNEYRYDPERARQLLAEAGWDPSTELKIIWYYPDALHQDIMAAIQQQLSQIGIRTSLQFMEGTSATQAQGACEFDLYYQGWGFAFPEDYASFFTKAERCRTPWDDPEVAEMFGEAVSIADPEARRSLYNEIQVRLNEELPMLPFIQFVGVTGLNNRVSGFGNESLWSMHYPWFHGKGFSEAVNWSLSD
jgi:peptide/nickel transport system substrate-binding protein